MPDKSRETARVVIVDPHPVWRQRWIDYLHRERDIHVLGAGTDMTDSFGAVPSAKKPNVLLANADHFPMKGGREWAILRGLLDRDVHVAAVTSGEDKHTLETLLGVGVVALQPPWVDASVLGRALRNAAQGVVDYNPALVDRIKEYLLGAERVGEARFGGLVIDLQRKSASRWGGSIQLTPLEFRVLEQLARHQGQPIRAEELLQRVWGVSFEEGGTLDQVHSCIKRLRRKIEPDVTHPRYLRSVWGEGYFWTIHSKIDRTWATQNKGHAWNTDRI